MGARRGWCEGIYDLRYTIYARRGAGIFNHEKHERGKGKGILLLGRQEERKKGKEF
jgi:hypothetical protein